MTTSTAKFQIEKIFILPNKNYFVLAGTIIEGTIAKGMHVINPMGKISIETIEFADKISENIFLVSIVIRYYNEPYLSELKSSFRVGQVIDIA